MQRISEITTGLEVGVDLTDGKGGHINIRGQRPRFTKPKTFPSKEREAKKVNPKVAKQINKVLTGNAPWPIYLHGTTGCGKTCTGLVISDYYGGEYTTLADWLSKAIRIEKSQEQWSTGFPVSYTELWMPWRMAIVTVLDEIGHREDVSGHHYDMLTKLMQYREGRTAIYISNLDLNEIASAYDDRIASRIGSGTVIELSSDGDRRMTG